MRGPEFGISGLQEEAAGAQRYIGSLKVRCLDLAIQRGQISHPARPDQHVERKLIFADAGRDKVPRRVKMGAGMRPNVEPGYVGRVASLQAGIQIDGDPWVTGPDRQRWGNRYRNINDPIPGGHICGS